MLIQFHEAKTTDKEQGWTPAKTRDKLKGACEQARDKKRDKAVTSEGEHPLNDTAGPTSITKIKLVKQQVDQPNQPNSLMPLYQVGLLMTSWNLREPGQQQTKALIRHPWCKIILGKSGNGYNQSVDQGLL